MVAKVGKITSNHFKNCLKNFSTSILLFAILGWSSQTIYSQINIPDELAVKDIKPGMKGYGLTVLKGTVPERFEVEIIDILHKFKADQDLILIKAKHPIIEHATTIGGVSGSPIYINDKIIGAWAYGWFFSKDPIGGVTPIVNMRKEMQRSIQSHVSLRTSKQILRGVEQSLGFNLNSVLKNNPIERFKSISTFQTNETVGPKRISTPVSFSGFHPQTLSMLSETFKNYGLEILEAGGGSEKTQSQYLNGGAIAIPLITGDLSASAIGTVTEVHGNKVSAFGHPMFNSGEVFLPAAPARIIHVMASAQRSFKMGEALATKGSLVHDRQSAIVIDTQILATMIPVQLSLHGLPKDAKDKWNFEIASNKLFSPSLIQSALDSAIKNAYNDTAELSLKSKSKIWIHGRTIPITLEDFSFSTNGVSIYDFKSIKMIDLLYNNPFEETNITKIEMEIDFDFNSRPSEIISLSASKIEVYPNEEVELTVRLKKYKGNYENQIVKIKIPYEAKGKNISISVEPARNIEPDMAKPDTITEVIQYVESLYPSTSLMLKAQLPSLGIQTQDHFVNQLPASQIEILTSVGQSEETKTFNCFHREEIKTPTWVTGNAKIELTVRKER